MWDNWKVDNTTVPIVTATQPLLLLSSLPPLQPQPSLSSLPLSPSPLLPPLLPPPQLPLSLLSLLLLLLLLQFPPMPRLIVVCACRYHNCCSRCCHCHHCHCCRSCCCPHCRCHCCCHHCSCCCPWHHCLTATSQFSIVTTIECSFHPPLPPLFLQLIATIKRQFTPSIATNPAVSSAWCSLPKWNELSLILQLMSLSVHHPKTLP
jgi:hypothetical protein